MSAEFNPYLQWLGIREAQRPIHHYRLLGVEPFEADPNVISMAADRQMAHLRTFQAGQYGELVQQLLNEITAAKLCLLKPDRKAAYDAQLRAKLAPAARPATPSATAPKTRPATGDFPSVVVSPASTAVKLPARAKNRWTPWAILGGLVMLCGVLTMILIKNNQPDPEKLANDDPKQPKTIVDKPSDTHLTSTKNPTTVENPPVGIAAPKNTLPNKAANPSPETTPVLPQPANPSAHDLKLARLIKQTVNTMVAQVAAQAVQAYGEEQAARVAANEPKIAVEPVAPMPAAPALPDKAAIAAKVKEIREIFKEEFASKKPEERLALAKKLLQSAQEQQDDRLTKLVLLQEARDLALQAGEAEVALQSTKQLCAEFQEELGESMVAAFTKLVAVAGRPPAYYQTLLGQAATAITEMQAHNEYDAALRLANIAQALARRLNDTASVSQTTALIKELTQLKTLFAKARAARETLKANPADAAANQIWGEFLCFAKNDFDEGLKHLAKGSNEDLAALAKRDLAHPQETDKVVALGDEWWAASDGEKDRVRANMRGRAIMHYQTVKPKLTGLAATKIEKRIAEAEATGGLSGNDAEWRKMLLATPWSITWSGGNKDVIKFKPDGSSENHLFVLWELVNGQLTARSAPQNPVKALITVKMVNGKYQVNFKDLNSGRTDTGVAAPTN